MVVMMNKEDDKPGEDGEVRAGGTAVSGAAVAGKDGAGSRLGTTGAAAAAVNGAVVLPAASRAGSLRGATAPNTAGGGGDGGGGGSGSGGGGGGGGGGFSLGGPQIAAVAGGAAVVGAVTGAAAAKLISNSNNNNNNNNSSSNINNNNNTEHHNISNDPTKYNEEDLRLNLYNDKEMTPIPEVAAVPIFQPRVRTGRGGTTVFNVQPNNTTNRGPTNTDWDEERPRKGLKPKKPVAKLLQPVQNPVSDFDDYRSQSDPPPQAASYAVPTPVRELDKHVIREELEARQTGRPGQANVRARQPHGLRF